MSPLAFQERPAAGEAEGLLVLHHGRGSDEHDLVGLADVLDPDRRLHVVTPGAPLTFTGSPGKHWYMVPRVGFPDPTTFAQGYGELAAFHDALWERTGLTPERTIFGGFSQGAVMSYALGLSGDRPAPAGILAFAGFVPTVDGWAPDLATRRSTRVFIAHGRRDPIMEVGFAQRARDLLEAGGLSVEYHESDAGHSIDPDHLAAAVSWVAATRPVDLRTVRRALLDVHRRLLQTQQAELEHATGHKMTPHEVLGAALGDPRFAWLRTLSELITQIDEAVMSKEPVPGAPAELGQRTRELVGPPDPSTPFGQRYLQALQANPDVVLAHRDLVAVL